MFHCVNALQSVLQQHHLQDAARLWDYCAQQLHFAPARGEAQRKTGEISLAGRDGTLHLRVYLSQNQIQRRGWLLQQMPKLRELYENYLLCEARDIKTRAALCYAEDRLAANDSWRALLLVSLDEDAQSAHDLQKDWSARDFEQRKPLLQAFADQLNQLHGARLSHHNLHPVNLLINPETLKTCVDQLDHLGYQWRSVVASVNDLATFLAGMHCFDHADTEFFLQQYWRDCKLGLTYQGLRQRVLAQTAR